jgi:hypothetical protein
MLKPNPSLDEISSFIKKKYFFHFVSSAVYEIKYIYIQAKE